ncbi:serine/threonine-protein kinase [Nonomuraea africana]|uniref:non-specific serine/threonine protein kinase n=1 Tax=Nonomuraea africana TaxID=46171 RepID=A0ABR9K6C5_9ACTN|nr:serine/threonine-protein kinase [Nonomuraea africana]MBE1557323.1 serine/threonine-protein kinase [Nonomuraea africana]
MAVGGSEASLGSRYVLLNEIGAGAMGTVWRARRRDTSEIVAVKLLRDGLAGDQDLVLRFVQERNVMRSLRHPNIATVRDFVIEGERLALVMDFVDGGDLRALLQRRGTLPPADAARLMAQVADALAAAHAMGVVHRDIKPGNVLIEENTGQVRLTDFGVARIVHGPGLTHTTSIIGTPAYLSPEVADGSAATPAVDVYALGLILYELLAGRPPFVGDHPMALLRQHATAMPRRLPGMPETLWPIITACAEKVPAQRPSAGQVATALREAAPSLAGLPPLPRVTRGDAPSVTSEPLPAMDGPAPEPIRTAPTGEGTVAPTGEGTVASVRRGRSGQRLAVIATTAVALVASAAAVAVVAPWRAPDAGAAPSLAVASAESIQRQTGATTPAADTTSPRAAKSTPATSPKARPPKIRTPKAAVSEPSGRPSTAEPSPERPRTPRPQRSTPAPTDLTDEGQPPEPERQDSEPNWRCRSWISTGAGTGTEMSPCIAVVGDEFRLMGRIRGSVSVSSDIHVQLYNTDAETNVSQPFICSGVSPSSEGEVVTCGPFTATAPRTGAKLDVRQRWRRTGTSAYGGGAESQFVIW